MARDGPGAPSARTRWVLQPQGFARLGNVATPLVSDAPGEELSQAPPPRGGLEALFEGGHDSRLIHPDEIDVIVGAMLEDDASKWLPVGAQSDGVSITRLASEPLSGCITVKLVARLPGVPLEVGADQAFNFSNRQKWDTQVVDFQGHDEFGCREHHANNLFYFNIHLPPLTDRDFLSFYAMAAADDESGIVTLIRSARHPAYSAGRRGRLRCEIHGCAVALTRDEHDPAGSSCLTMITKQDIKMPIIPHWMVNYFLPGQLKQWSKSLHKACMQEVGKLQRDDDGRLQLPLPDLFPGIPTDEASKQADSAPAREAEEATPAAAAACPPQTQDVEPASPKLPRTCLCGVVRRRPRRQPRP